MPMPGEDAYPRPLLFGVPIGEVGDFPMPRRTSLGTCADCLKVIWLNDNHVNQLDKEDEPIVLCIECTLKRGEDVYCAPAEWYVIRGKR